MELKRSITHALGRWKESPNRKPLVLKGARQVGKTHALKEFANANFEAVAYLNLEELPSAGEIFSADLSPTKLTRDIALFTGVSVEAKRAVLIIDEIQMVPQALTSLKYFAEKLPELHVIAAGSLLGIALNEGHSFPVGKVNFLSMYPLSFQEFIAAHDEPGLEQALNEVSVKKRLPEGIHTKLLEYLRLYYFVGGMPEVVSRWLAQKDPSLVRNTQREILLSYENDFAKHAGGANGLRIKQLWEAVPKQLSLDKKKFMLSLIHPGARSREYELALQWLVDAGLVLRSTKIKSARLPLKHYEDPASIKLYLLDVGLLTCLWDLPAKVFTDPAPSLFQEAKGPLAENFVAQELTVAEKTPLHYWTSQSSAEVDFVISSENGIFPLEVKAGSSANNKSLRVFAEANLGIPLARASTKNFAIDGAITNYPLYSIKGLGES